MLWPWLLAGGIVLLVVFLVVMWWIGSRVPAYARSLFERERQQLQEQFFEAAAGSGKPRGLRWVNCEWEQDLVLARDRSAIGQLVGLVGVTIQFEAIPGSDMEGLPAVGNLRNASAVFVFSRGQWVPTGRALFNLNPEEAIQHLDDQFEGVEVKKD